MSGLDVFIGIAIVFFLASIALTVAYYTSPEFKQWVDDTLYKKSSDSSDTATTPVATTGAATTAAATTTTTTTATTAAPAPVPATPDPEPKPETGAGLIEVPSVPTPLASAAPVKARQTLITNCGYADKPRGWFDIQGQGVRNDYCRFVSAGSTGQAKFVCALAGGTEQETPVDEARSTGAFTAPGPGEPCSGATVTTVVATTTTTAAAAAVKPRTYKGGDCGYGTLPRGWYDYSKQGARNDFCRWVGDHADAFACQLAGSDNLYAVMLKGPEALAASAQPHTRLAQGDLCFSSDDSAPEGVPNIGV
jgi:hypothetical protein